ncbi:PTS sugar transporter subunit IIB [Candidatus Pantoea persica]|uniref:PTS sugar transporter subunit IIB n=1 Tax=Candidatus Pantoea persica TaxID=2518128 RepID=UPI00215D7018|nr:PTS sugar transporter subunit IIB [Candidatus Pantoea persica]MBA2817837.1 Ascorbate-specific phosphotransferase enzyme IIB component [Candidatus Pantoea persica]
MKKVLIVCGNGLGSSFIVEMNVKKIVAEVSYTDLTSAMLEPADLIISAKDIADRLTGHRAQVFSLTNLLDDAQIKTILAEHL